MSRETRGKIISVVILLGVIALIVARFWDTLAGGFLLIGRLMTGEFTPPNAAAWFVIILLILFVAAVIAAIVFFVRLIILAIKEKDR